ncbi:hypothetical protein IAD21_06428 (plasmid) [Abditibacteriota bacterium]|nr:hypothetical protein IAD21_06428 [Abditibacteriota bacterium]
MSESDVQHIRTKTIVWQGDWQPKVSQEQRDQVQALFAEMMTDCPPNYLQHITDQACETIQTVLTRRHVVEVVLMRGGLFLNFPLCGRIRRLISLPNF